MKIIFALAFSVLLGLVAATESAVSQTFELQLFSNGNTGCFAGPNEPLDTVSISLAQLNLPDATSIGSSNQPLFQMYSSARIVNVNSNLFGQDLVVGLCNDGYEDGCLFKEPVCSKTQLGFMKLTNEPSNCAENLQLQSWLFQACPNSNCDPQVLNH